MAGGRTTVRRKRAGLRGERPPLLHSRSSETVAEPRSSVTQARPLRPSKQAIRVQIARSRFRVGPCDALEALSCDQRDTSLEHSHDVTPCHGRRAGTPHVSPAAHLGKTNKTGIGQGHRTVPIAPHQCAHIRLLFLNSEADADRPPLQQDSRFCENRLHVSRGGRSCFHCSTTHRWCARSQARKLTREPGVEQADPVTHLPNRPCIAGWLQGRAEGL
jgi:hypothetical protein